MLSKILIEGVHLWFTSDNTLMPNQYPVKYRQLIRQQNRIGWRQLFNGRLSREWANLQNDYIYVRHQRLQETHQSAQKDGAYSTLSDRRNGLTWTAAIIQEIWDRWFELWAMRNADVHGNDQQTRHTHQESNNIARLQTIYDNRGSLEPRVRDELLYTTMEEHLEKSRHTLHNWLAVHEATITQSIKQAAKRAITGIRSIRTYFTSQNTPGVQGRTDATAIQTDRLGVRATAHRRQLQTQSPAGP